MTRKLTALLLAGLMLLLLSGCAAPPVENRLTVVASIFPEYDWVRQILGADSSVELVLLVDDGVDPHSFQPTVRDIVTVSRCDLLVYTGGESDEWLEDVLEDADPDMLILPLLPMLGERAHAAEVTEGMQVREAEDETDEHVWLSLRNAALFCRQITDALCRMNPDHAESYRKNLSDYLEKLDELDQRYCHIIAESPKDTILICDRFPFRYLVEDYGLSYYAAFPGCSAESGASFQTIVFLSDTARRLDLNAVLTLEGSDTRLARTVAESSGLNDVQLLVLDSMQSVSLRDAADRSYLSTMERNLHVLEEALR